MRGWLVGLMLVFAVGCVGPSENYLRIEGDANKKEAYHYKVIEDIPSNVRMLHKNPQEVALKHCKYKYTSEQMADLRQEDKNQSWFYGCTDVVKPQILVGSSAIEQTQGVVAAGLIAGSIAYAGHQVGKGLGRSGDQTTNNNNTSSEGGEGGDASATGGSSSASHQQNVGNKTTNIKPSTNINSNNVIKTK